MIAYNTEKQTYMVKIEITEEFDKNIKKPEEEVDIVCWHLKEKKHQRNASWYFWMGLSIIIFGAYSLWRHDYYFLILILAAIFTFYIMSQKKSPEVDAKLSLEKISIGNQIINLNHFFIYEIVEKPEHFIVALGTKRFPYFPTMLFLEKEDQGKIQEIKNILGRTLKEGKVYNSFDNLIEKMKI